MVTIEQVRVGNVFKRESQPEGFVLDIHSLVRIANGAEDYEPIPLSIEWLDKFKFERQGKRNMWIKNKCCVILMDYPDIAGNSTGEKFYIGFKDMGNSIYHTQFEIPYVHNLQNAYSLTGEELI